MLLFLYVLSILLSGVSSSPVITLSVTSVNGTIFNVTSREGKVPGDQFYGVGYNGLYVVNGADAPVLNLVRGNTYFFNISSSSIHPFYLTTDSVGEGAGTALSTPTSSAMLTYVADPLGSGTTTLYYQCDFHQNLGNAMIISPNAAHAEYAVNSLLFVLLVLTSVGTLFF